MKHDDYTTMNETMEMLIATGTEEIAKIFTSLFNEAMKIERERFLGAKKYERSASRHGYANGFKPRYLDMELGTICVAIPKTRGGDAPFYPQSLYRGCRASKPVKAIICEMYIKGFSIRDVEGILKEMDIENISSNQVSRVTKMMDEELNTWRNRPLGIYSYVISRCCYEKVRVGGVIQD